MAMDTQLDTSLTSMEWLNRLAVNKQFNPDNVKSNYFAAAVAAAGGGGGGGTSSSFNNISSSSGISGSCEPPNTKYSEILINLPENVAFNGDYQTAAMQQPQLHQQQQQPQHQQQLPNGTLVLKPPAYLSAQRAEPNRPVDLNAEYRGGDHNKREGKPPYSYVNLITFAINSSPRKRMTLNDIYEWISDNFHYYRRAGNGWKVVGFNYRYQNRERGS
jgi:hypothetical protein